MSENEKLVERLRGVDHMSVEDCFLQSHLFAQAATALTLAQARIRELETALAWLGAKKSRSLSFDGRIFCEDDNSDMWTVTEERGPINDREWVVLGAGNTPAEALLNASTATRALKEAQP